MKVLVTGATGFIGSEIVAELSKNKIEVIQLGSSKSKLKDVTKDRPANFFARDITNYENLAEIEKIGNIDALVHTAGLAHQFGEIEKAKFEAVNVAGTKNAARLAVKLNARHFVLISSTAIYGIKKVDGREKGKAYVVIKEEDECQPQTLYAESKLEAERAAIKICETERIALTILRLAPVIGEKNVGNAARLVSAIDKRRFVWIGDGENLKSLIYKKDVAAACLRILEKKRGGTEVFNLAAEPIKMQDFVAEIAGLLGKPIPKIKLPTGIFRIIFQINSKFIGLRRIKKLSDTFEKWLSDDIYSANKIKRIYGFEPEFTVEQAIERQVKQYKSDGR